MKTAIRALLILLLTGAPPAGAALMSFVDLGAPVPRPKSCELNLDRQLLYRRSAAELLHLMIFDHPMLEAILARAPDPADLMRFFHLTAGFELPPLGGEPRDLAQSTYYLTRSGYEPGGWLDRWRVFRSRRHIDHRWLRDRLISFALPARGDEAETQMFEQLGKRIAGALLKTLGDMSNPMNWRDDPDFPKVRTSIDRGASGSMPVYLPTEGLLSRAELSHFRPLHENAYGVELELVKFISHYLPAIIEIREDILARVQRGDAREWQKATPLKAELGEQIRRLIAGEPLEPLPSRRRALAAPVADLRDLHPMLPAPTPAPDDAAVRKELARPSPKFAVPATLDGAVAGLHAALAPARAAQTLIGAQMATLPPPFNPRRLRERWTASPDGVVVFQRHLTELQARAGLDLAAVESVERNVRALHERVAAPLARFEARLSARAAGEGSGLRPVTAGLVQDTLEEARLLALTLRQSREASTQRLERQGQWVAQLARLQALAQQYLIVTATGADGDLAPIEEALGAL